MKAWRGAVTMVAVLAAGSATRFGSDKLSALLDGEPLLFHAVRAARAAPVSRVIVVARPGLETGQWEGDPPVEVLRVTSKALSDSLGARVSLAPQVDPALVGGLRVEVAGRRLDATVRGRLSALREDLLEAPLRQT